MLNKDHVAIIISASALFIAVINFFLNQRSARRAKIKNNSEETQKAYAEWFGMDFYRLRRSYEIAISKVKNNDEWKTKKLEEMVQGKDLESIKEVHYFFDRIGWLSNAGLIDTNFILCPMKLWVVNTWIDLKPIIYQKRSTDPIHGLGHEQLAIYAESAKFKKIFFKIWKQN